MPSFQKFIYFRFNGLRKYFAMEGLTGVWDMAWHLRLLWQGQTSNLLDEHTRAAGRLCPTAGIGLLMNKPIFDQINLICGDLDASIAFYRRLGVEIPDARVWRTPSGGHHASAVGQSTDQAIDFDLDSTVFAQTWNSSWKGRTDLRGRVIVGFGVATRTDVDDVFRDMTGAGYRGLQEPHDAIWGARYAIIEDPDGIAVGLMSPVSPDKRSPSPDL
jgi:catechol 2,3-dioxygenase-like lactoylglutathione lyase family enzyme